jgi:hypothetical protein
MDRRSFTYKLTPEDRLIIGKWKLRIGLVYGTVLIALVLIMIVRPSQRSTEIAEAPAMRSYAPASLMPSLLPDEKR